MRRFCKRNLVPELLAVGLTFAFFVGMMTIPERWWRAGWTNCPGCGSWFVRRSLVCGACEDHLRAVARAPVDQKGAWIHRRLFDWIPEADDILSNFLIAMKGPGAADAWDEWAAIFLQRHIVSRDFQIRRKVFVAAPARHDREDHSSLFARALARQLGRPYRGRLLGKSGGRSHRNLSRFDRFMGTGFVKLTGFGLEPGEEVIFVDDVLTTGATVFAIRQALPSKAGFEAWTLAGRTRSLAGRPGL